MSLPELVGWLLLKWTEGGLESPAMVRDIRYSIIAYAELAAVMLLISYILIIGGQ